MTSRVVWLASYPKSGNTWLRMLLANLGAERPADINALPVPGGIASGRARFDAAMLFPSGLLTHEECDRLRPYVYRAAAAREPESGDDEPAGGELSGTRFLKTHDAWTLTATGEPLLGGVEAARAAILVVRDPRDVAASLANHNRQSLDEAIAFMADTGAAFCGRDDRQPNQLRQQLPGWSGFQASWLDQDELPLHLLRYEDLQADTEAAFWGVLDFAGVAVAPGSIAQAVRFAGFAGLRAQEEARGFREAPKREGDARFFRRGIAGGWRDEISDEQRRRIERDHGAMMARLGYRPA